MPSNYSEEEHYYFTTWEYNTFYIFQDGKLTAGSQNTKNHYQVMTKAQLTKGFRNVLLSHCAALAGLYVFVLNQQCGLTVLYSYTHST